MWRVSSGIHSDGTRRAAGGENALNLLCSLLRLQGSFDSASTSLREVAAPLRMTLVTIAGQAGASLPGNCRPAYIH